MKYDLQCMKTVLNYVLDTLTLDESGSPYSTYTGIIIENILKNNTYTREEITYALLRCLREGFLVANSGTRPTFDMTRIEDVTLLGYMWLKDDKN